MVLMSSFSGVRRVSDVGVLFRARRELRRMSTHTRDRRRDPRVTVWSPLILTVEGESFPATLQNLSLMGVGCTCGQSRAGGTRLGVQLELSAEGGEHLKLTIDAQVVRCDPVRKGSARERYRLGLAFDEISDEQRRHLERFLDWSTVQDDDAP
jgi:c-di-GMP-binding flagellar brake protein YcgR